MIFITFSLFDDELPAGGGRRKALAERAVLTRFYDLPMLLVPVLALVEFKQHASWAGAG